MTLSDHTKIEAKTVMWLLAAAVSYGVMFEQLQQARTDIARQGRDLAEIKAILTRSGGVAAK